MSLSSKSDTHVSLSQLTTYQAGILHAQSYRQLKRIKNEILGKHGLTMMQWAILGMIHDAGTRGTRMTELAQALDTTNAYVTTTINLLEAKGFVSRLTDEKDTRSKYVSLVPSRRKKIAEIEADVREELRKTLYGKVSRDELETFVRVLAKFAQK
jgi:DNA-binding MarR family transcriptional regulator